MRVRHSFIVCFFVILAVACGDDDLGGPAIEVPFGETSFVVLVNPRINALNSVTMPQPGTVRSGVSVAADGTAAVTSNASGIAVLSPVAAGTRTITLSSGSLSGSVSSAIAQGDLKEVAIALTGSGAQTMAEVLYRFGGRVVDLSPSTPLATVNTELAGSNTIVFLRGGTYTGDLRFTGSDVTLFGEGTSGGMVTINGNVTIEGSGNRIRGARINGNLTITGSGAGVSFTRVQGALTLGGSGATLLNNAFCGTATITGSNARLLGNAGLDPIPASEGGC
jgi:hypothetical protein